MEAAGMPQYFQALARVSFTHAQTGAIPKTEDQALRRIATEFEAIFLGELLKSMRNTILESGFFGQDRASKIYREMRDEAYAYEMAASGQLGFGDMMYEELRKGL